MVPHVVESYSPEGEAILSLGTMYRGESDVNTAVEAAAEAMLVEWQEARLSMESFSHLVPLPKHLAKVEMVGIARLRYLPSTETTAAWFEKESQKWAEWARRYREMEIAAKGRVRGLFVGYATSRLDQGLIKVISKEDQRYLLLQN